MSAMAAPDGTRHIAQMGAASDTTWRLRQLQPDTRYYWSVQALDHNFAGSVFAVEDSFVTPLPAFTHLAAPLAQVSAGGSAWGDYDNDGDLDLALSGWDSSQVRYSRIYRNANGSLVDINAALSQLSNGSLAWGDYDNDGDLDLVLTGFPDGGSGYVSQIYRNDNGSFVNIQANLLGSG
ncbi:MAG: VCBS repeat-containing protein, partial [Candidatus Eisenbacteria bacterium]|nr:VCBS repeat-containing protein [Candidatus Eisenbacteria bacterium]